MLNTICPKCGSHLEYPVEHTTRELLCTVCGHKYHSFAYPPQHHHVSHWKFKDWKRLLTGSAA